ncbi:MAG: hypothetical protein MHM6MM_003260 [Cercozoa sp. M6MM]
MGKGNLRKLLKKRMSAASDQSAVTSAAASSAPKSQAQKKRKPHRMQNRQQKAAEKKKVAPTKAAKPVSTEAKKSQTAQEKRLSKMRAKLEGAAFRRLNEQLYTTQGASALKQFSADPSLFEVYHRGFAEQVKKWPENPVDVFVERVLGRSDRKRLVLGDFGCGEAQLARDTRDNVSRVHSFDLVAGNELITACDIANVPLEDNTLDVAVFCLSLMGTNFVDFLKEAHRCLKVGGELWIAEVQSRFSKPFPAFVQLCRRIGFDVVGQPDASNKMFVLFTFRKSERKPAKNVTGKRYADFLKPCIYKRR